jgi:hypothetical protein
MRSMRPQVPNSETIWDRVVETLDSYERVSNLSRTNDPFS